MTCWSSSNLSMRPWGFCDWGDAEEVANEDRTVDSFAEGCAYGFGGPLAAGAPCAFTRSNSRRSSRASLLLRSCSARRSPSCELSACTWTCRSRIRSESARTADGDSDATELDESALRTSCPCASAEYRKRKPITAQIFRGLFGKPLLRIFASLNARNPMPQGAKPERTRGTPM